MLKYELKLTVIIRNTEPTTLILYIIFIISIMGHLHDVHKVNA